MSQSAIAVANNATGMANKAEHRDIWLYLATLAALASLGERFVASVEVAAITKVTLHEIRSTNKRPSTANTVLASIDLGNVTLPIFTFYLCFANVACTSSARSLARHIAKPPSKRSPLAWSWHAPSPAYSAP